MQLQQKDTECGSRSSFLEGRSVLVPGDAHENTRVCWVAALSGDSLVNKVGVFDFEDAPRWKAITGRYK